MRRLTIEQMGEKVQGITLHGDRRNPEPETVRIVLPCGEVEVVRNADDSYWVHLTTIKVDGGLKQAIGQLVDGRLDIQGKHGSDCDAGDFANPKLYHLAVRLEKKP